MKALPCINPVFIIPGAIWPSLPTDLGDFPNMIGLGIEGWNQDCQIRVNGHQWL